MRSQEACPRSFPLESTVTAIPKNRRRVRETEAKKKAFTGSGINKQRKKSHVDVCIYTT
jgi:hypothetical protein